MSETLETIGRKLRRVREDMGLSYQDVSVRTRIQIPYLQAIETMDAKALPSLGYVLGFVRAYAECLGLNGVEAVKRYKQDIAAPKNLTLRDGAIFISKRKIRLPRGFISAVTVMVCAVSAALWYGWQADIQSQTLTVAQTAQQANADGTPQDKLSTNPNILTVKAMGPSWVRVTDSEGQVLVSRIFVKGETWQTPTESGAVFDIRDSGALALYKGDVLVGRLGEAGRPVLGLILDEALRPKLAGFGTSDPAFDVPQ